MNSKVKKVIESEIKELRERIKSFTKHTKRLDDKALKLVEKQKMLSYAIHDKQQAIDRFKKELKELEDMWEE